MKLLENSKLEAISSILSIDTPVCDITTRSVNKNYIIQKIKKQEFFSFF
jgi:peroxiredoxin